MPFWQSSRNTYREHDRLTTSASVQSVQPQQQQQPFMRKAASMATLAWPRPASSPIAPVDRSPYPPRISSLGRVPPLGWDAERLLLTPPRGATAPSSRRPASAHSGGVEMAPGTVHASAISRKGTGPGTGTDRRDTSRDTAGTRTAKESGTRPGTTTDITNLSQHQRSAATTTTSFAVTTTAAVTPTAAADEVDAYLDASRRNVSLQALETATATGHVPMSSGGFDLRNGHNTSSSPQPPQSDPSNFLLPSPTMRKASPMPQALPQPAYPTPSTPWQHATNGLTSPTDSTPPAGKTSQVLAKLTSECDRLRREIKAEKAAKEEAVQQFQAVKGRVNWLEDKNSTLTMQLDANENALARKERRLDDLKASLEEEVARRKRAEEREAEMGRKLGETVSQAAKEVSEAHMAQKNAENAYATLENEYGGLQRRIGFLRKEVEELTRKINDNSAVHKRQLTQLEILLDQQRQQQEKSNRQVQEMGSLLRSYRDTEENTKRLETEMQDAVHEMRWVMRLHASREGRENDAVVVPAPSQQAPQQQSKKKHASSPSKSSLKKAPLVNGAPI